MKKVFTIMKIVCLLNEFRQYHQKTHTMLCLAGGASQRAQPAVWTRRHNTAARPQARQVRLDASRKRHARHAQTHGVTMARSLSSPGACLIPRTLLRHELPTQKLQRPDVVRKKGPACMPRLLTSRSRGLLHAHTHIKTAAME